MTYPFTEWSCPTEASAILGGIAFRLIIELASKFIEVNLISKSGPEILKPR
jgi:hypothetical protein